MKKRIISILCALALVVAMLPPVTASAAAPTTLTVGGTDVLSGGYWTTNADGTLTLKDATITGTDTIGHVGTGIYAEGDLTIVLEGSSPRHSARAQRMLMIRFFIIGVPPFQNHNL